MADDAIPNGYGGEQVAPPTAEQPPVGGLKGFIDEWNEAMAEAEPAAPEPAPAPMPEFPSWNPPAPDPSAAIDRMGFQLQDMQRRLAETDSRHREQIDRLDAETIIARARDAVPHLAELSDTDVAELIASPGLRDSWESRRDDPARFERELNGSLSRVEQIVERAAGAQLGSVSSAMTMARGSYAAAPMALPGLPSARTMMKMSDSEWNALTARAAKEGLR